MDLGRKIELLRQTVAAERAAIRTQKMVAMGACVVGLAAGAILVFAGPTLSGKTQWALGVCATMISMGGGSLSLKDVPVAKRRIAALTYLETEFLALAEGDGSAEQVKELEDHFSAGAGEEPLICPR